MKILASVLLLCILLIGCTGAEVAGAAVFIGAGTKAFVDIHKEAKKKKVLDIVTDNPQEFYLLLGKIVVAVIGVWTLAQKAGRDHKNGNRHK